MPSLMIKKTFSSQFILPGGRFFCEFVARKKNCGLNTKIFSACLKYKPGFYFFSLYKTQMSKQHRLINQAEPNLENSSYLPLSSWGKLESPAQSDIRNLSFQSLCKLGKIMYRLTPKFKNVEKTEGIYLKQGWSHLT